MDDLEKSASYTLEKPDPDSYRSGPVPLSPGKLSEGLRESDVVTNRESGRAWAVLVIVVLAASFLVMITKLL